MLTKLVEYAERPDIAVGDPHFETREVHYLIEVASDGKFLGLVPLGENQARGKKCPGLPRIPDDNNPGSERFLVANASHVLGAERPGSAGYAAACSQAYRELIRSAAGQSEDDALKALEMFLDQEGEIAAAAAALKQSVGNSPDERWSKVLAPAWRGTTIHSRDAVRRWWIQRPAGGSRDESATSVRCLVTGTIGPAKRTHYKIKGLGKDSSPLVSFQAPAFESLFLTKGENAPVSTIAVAKYTEAINKLLEKDPARKNRRKSAIDLDESVAIFWTKEPSDATGYVLDVLNPLPDSSDAVDAGMSVWKGRQFTTFSSTPFYACTLTGTKGRVIVRDWFETTAAAVKQNLDRWFDDLRVGVTEPQPVPLPALLDSLEAAPGARNDKRGLPPGLATTLFRAAVLGGRLPVSLLAAAVTRMRVPPPKERQKKDVHLPLRVAVIKAVLRRTYERKEIDVALDENNTEPAYLLGRLFAVLERLQGAAQYDDQRRALNATIRDRYFGAASATPAAVFPRLLRLSVHHESKLRGRGDTKGLAIWFDRLKVDIVSKLAARPLPPTLDLQSQGLFAIGYFHQRDTKKRDDPERSGGEPKVRNESEDDRHEGAV